MKLSQGQKILLGVLTVLPFIILPFIVFEIFGFVSETVVASQGGEPNPADVMAGIASFIGPILLLSFLSLTLLVFYIIHAINNKTIETTERVVWIVVFFFFGAIAFPIYWFMRIWDDGNKAAA